MERRTIKSTPPGTIPASVIKKSLHSVHVLARPSGRWEVRTLVPKRIAERFLSKADAVEYARSVARHPFRGIIVHDGHGRISHLQD